MPPAPSPARRSGYLAADERRAKRSSGNSRRRGPQVETGDVRCDEGWGGTAAHRAEAPRIPVARSGRDFLACARDEVPPDEDLLAERRPADQEGAGGDVGAQRELLASGGEVKERARCERLTGHARRAAQDQRRVLERGVEWHGERRPARGAEVQADERGVNLGRGGLPEGAAREDANAEATRLDERQVRMIAKGGCAAPLSFGQGDPQLRRVQFSRTARRRVFGVRDATVRAELHGSRVIEEAPGAHRAAVPVRQGTADGEAAADLGGARLEAFGREGMPAHAGVRELWMRILPVNTLWSG